MQVWGQSCPFDCFFFERFDDFALQPLPIYLDVSLKAFAEVFPSGGAHNTSVRISPDRLAELMGASWVDVMAAPLS
jgi:hypothetical protein